MEYIIAIVSKRPLFRKGFSISGGSKIKGKQEEKKTYSRRWTMVNGESSNSDAFAPDQTVDLGQIR